MIPYEPCQQLGQWFLPTGSLKFNQTVVAVTCVHVHLNHLVPTMVDDILPPICGKKGRLPMFILNKQLMQTGAARYVDVDQAARDGQRRRPRISKAAQTDESAATL